MKTQGPKSGLPFSEAHGGEARRDSIAELEASGCCAIPGTSLSICIGEHIGLAIERHYRELRAAPRQPASLTTGILLGRYETGKRKIASLEQLHPVAWRPVYGSEPRPLTPGQLFSPLVSAEANLQPVGFYVFASRPDTALLHRDLSLFSLYFTNPDSIFVLFSGTVDAAAVAHVYARGIGKVPLHSVGVTLHLNDLVPGPQSPPSALAAGVLSAIQKPAAPAGPVPKNTPQPQPAVGATSARPNSTAPLPENTPLPEPAPSSPLPENASLCQPTSQTPSTVPSRPIATSHPSSPIKSEPPPATGAPSTISKPSAPLAPGNPLTPPAGPDAPAFSKFAAQSSPLAKVDALPEVAANVPAGSLRRPSFASPAPAVPWNPLTTSPLLSEPAADTPGRIPRNTLWAVAAIILISAGTAWYTLSSGALQSSGPAQIGLRIVQTGPDVQIAWNAASPALRDATAASFQIRDGDSNKDITLSPDELKRGRLLYIPATNDLDVHMLVRKPDNRTAEDSVRMIGGLHDTPDLPTGQPAPRAVRPSSRPAPTAARGAAETPAATSVKQFIAPPSMVESSSQTGIAVSNLPPPQLPPQTGQPDAAFPLPYREAPAIQPPPATPPPIAEQTRTQPVRPMQAQSVVIPPKPRRLVPLVIPEHLRRSIVRDLSIDIHCRVGADGQVTSVTTPSGKASLEGQLSALAAATARNWLFTPARLHGQPVSSDYVITFSFHRKTP